MADILVLSFEDHFTCKIISIWRHDGISEHLYSRQVCRYVYHSLTDFFVTRTYLTAG